MVRVVNANDRQTTGKLSPLEVEEYEPDGHDLFDDKFFIEHIYLNLGGELQSSKICLIFFEGVTLFQNK